MALPQRRKRSLWAGVSQRAAVRLLEQSTFGPGAAQLVALETGGMEQFLTAQFQAPVSPYPDPDPTANDVSSLQTAFFQNAMNPQAGSDQLRQRVVFALNQIWVVSATRSASHGSRRPICGCLQRMRSPTTGTSW